VLPGYYRLNSSLTGTLCPDAPVGNSSSTSMCVVPCSPASACLGDNACAPEYVSLPPTYLCGNCAPGHYHAQGICVPCPVIGAVYLILYALGAAFVAALAYGLAKFNINFGGVLLVIDFLQTMSVLQARHIVLPPALAGLIDLMSAASINLDLVAAECWVGRSPDFRMLGVLILPIIAVAFALFTYVTILALKLCMGPNNKSLHGHLPPIINYLVLVLWFLYFPFIRACLEPFNCVPTNPPTVNQDGTPVEYLQVVFEQCHQPGGLQERLLVPAIVGIVVFVVGFPLTLGCAMLRWRHLIAEDQLLRAVGTGDTRRTNPNARWLRRTLGSVYKIYKPGCEWVLLLTFVRRAIVAVLMLMLNRNTILQLTAVAVTVGLAGSLQDAFWPMMSSTEVSSVLTQHAVEVQRGDAAALRLHATFLALAAGKGSGGQKMAKLIKPSAAFKPQEATRSGRALCAAKLANWNILALTLKSCAITCVSLIAVFQTITINDPTAMVTHYRSMDDAIGDTFILACTCAFLYSVYVVGYDVVTQLREVMPKHFKSSGARLHDSTGSDADAATGSGSIDSDERGERKARHPDKANSSNSTTSGRQQSQRRLEAATVSGINADHARPGDGPQGRKKRHATPEEHQLTEPQPHLMTLPRGSPVTGSIRGSGASSNSTINALAVFGGPMAPSSTGNNGGVLQWQGEARAGRTVTADDSGITGNAVSDIVTTMSPLAELVPTLRYARVAHMGQNHQQLPSRPNGQVSDSIRTVQHGP
jgi:hypothetical protein